MNVKTKRNVRRFKKSRKRNRLRTKRRNRLRAKTLTKIKHKQNKKNHVGGIIADLNQRYGRGSILHSDMLLAASMAEAQRREADMRLIERQIAERRAAHLRRRKNPAVNVMREMISADRWYRSLPDSSPIKKFIFKLNSLPLHTLSDIATNLLHEGEDGALELDLFSILLMEKAVQKQNKESYINFIKDVLWINHIDGRGGVDIYNIYNDNDNDV